MDVRLREFAGICGVGFVLMLGYELSRSSVETLFRAEHGSESLPWAWLCVAIAAPIAVSAYAALSYRVDLARLFTGTVVVSAALLVLGDLARRAGVPGSYYFLYVWKDVHIVVLVEILWTFANLVFRVKTARWAYGVLLVFGSLGGASGGLIVGALATEYGTDSALMSALVPFAILFGVGALVERLALAPIRMPKAERVDLREALRAFRASSHLPWLLALVVIVQLVVNLVDYHYNARLEAAYPNIDEQTRVSGQVSSAFNVAAIGLQLVTPLILRYAGVSIALIGIPIVVLGTVLASIANPRFLAVAVMKVASKALDYSIFKAAKEILYIPLSYSEKTRGKAIVDMLGYRVAKGLASAILGAMVGIGFSDVALGLAIALIAAWVVVTVRIVRRHGSLVEKQLTAP